MKEISGDKVLIRCNGCGKVIDRCYCDDKKVHEIDFPFPISDWCKDCWGSQTKGEGWLR